ncbi:MAG: STAS domain-containing protein [Desulfobacterales bacterium]
MPVTFRRSHQPPWECIKPEGDMTAETSEELITVLSDLIRRQHCNIRFDLSNVRDIDVVSLHILVLFFQRMSKELPSAELEIIDADEDIRNLFRMTHLDRVCRII